MWSGRMLYGVRGCCVEWEVAMLGVRLSCGVGGSRMEWEVVVWSRRLPCEVGGGTVWSGRLPCGIGGCRVGREVAMLSGRLPCEPYHLDRQYIGSVVQDVRVKQTSKSKNIN